MSYENQEKNKFMIFHDILQFKYVENTGGYNLTQSGSVLIDSIYKNGGTLQTHGVTSNFKMNFLNG